MGSPYSRVKSVFVQIASYRDPQLVPTLRDMFAKADYPEYLNVCIAWQRSEVETLEEFSNHPQFKVLDIPHTESKGACWARNLIQQNYSGEEFTLQLDSHMRFAKGWDTELIKVYNELKAAGHKKPLLTAYLPSFDPDIHPEGTKNEAWQMNFDRFTSDGIVLFSAGQIDSDYLAFPIPSRFYSAHFCFTSGDFCKEVPHDPNLYFHGEEISISVRAYTWGYDMFHPVKSVIWHEYTRKNRTKHWDEHLEWWHADKRSRQRVRVLLGMEEPKEQLDFGPYGLGPERTIRDYELYSALCFLTRSIDPYRISMLAGTFKILAPYDKWVEYLQYVFKYCIDIPKGTINPDNHDFWYVAFLDTGGEEIYRQDVGTDELEYLKHTPPHQENYHVWRTFYPKTPPVSWKVWPHSKEGKWGNPIQGKV